jgi:hypothetical protein
MLPMTKRDDLSRAISDTIGELMLHYDQRVTERAPFPDLRAGRQFHFDDPDTTLPGRFELVVMNMDPRLDPKYDRLRFLSVRVMKSRQGGYSSTTCLHGTKEELREQLTVLAHDPGFLIDRVTELADGLPEESNPDIWK